MYLLIYNQDTNILIGEEKMRKYKKPLKIEEQIQYLKDNKRVIFKNESEEESKEYLLINNYINVISLLFHYRTGFREGSCRNQRGIRGLE